MDAIERNKATRIFIVSAPSGTGKTTLNRRLIAEHPTVEVAVSYTARPMRPGETDGEHYHFVTGEAFLGLIKRGDMLEWAEVFGKLYGTPLAEIRRIQASGRSVILEIDVQGWRQAKDKLSEACAIFILPPSVAALWSRLEQRGTESLEVRWRRLMTARDEIASGPLYDHFIVNSDLSHAYRELEGVIIKGKKPSLSADEGRAFCLRLLAEFDSAPWIQKLAQEISGV